MDADEEQQPSERPPDLEGDLDMAELAPVGGDRDPEARPDGDDGAADVLVLELCPV